jgi:DNA-directed RNA polymerase specialized sigma24 family protein
MFVSFCKADNPEGSPEMAAALDQTALHRSSEQLPEVCKAVFISREFEDPWGSVSCA